MAGMSNDGMVEIEKPINVDDVEQELAMTHAKSCVPDTCIAVKSVDGMMEIVKPINVDDSTTEHVELCGTLDGVEQELAIAHGKSCDAPDTCIAVVSDDGTMEVDKPVNVDDSKCDATEQEELCVEKEKLRTINCTGLHCCAKNCAPDTCVAGMSNEMMEIGKPVNVDDSKCDAGNERELHVEKEKFRALDGAELNSCAQNCADDSCMVVRSEVMMEIGKPENFDDSKCDRRRVVDAATEQEEVCVKKQKIETLDRVELDCCATDHVKNYAPDSVVGVEVEHCATNCEPETADDVEVKGNATNPKPETVETEGCAANRKPETAELEGCAANHKPKTVELEGCATNREPETVELEGCPTNREPETVELEGCATNHALQTLNTEEMECDEKELKKVNNCANQPDVRHDVKEDDMLSEVSNPNLSPKENTSSFQTASSQGVDLLSNNQGGSGEITSSLSGNSSAEESVSEEDHNQIDASKAVAKSSVVLEIPEEFSTTGVRKITFKFSKRKEDYGNASAAAALPVTAGVGYGFSEAQAQNTLESDDMSLHGISSTKEAFYQHRDPFSCPLNMELKMSKKVTSDAFPTNVKKLLSTGILEGARVKYISTSGKKELLGIIKDYGYLCGCSLCNFSKILSAYEFEMHAGGKTRHPNNHIYLENGKPIYRIIQELKTAPLSQLEEVVKGVAGSSINEQYLEAWKAKLLQPYQVASGRASGMYQYKPSDCSSVMEDGLYPASYSYIDNFPPTPYSSMETAEYWKHVVKKPRCNFSSSTIEPKKPAEGGTKKRDNDLHRSLFMPNGLPDGTDLAYYSKGKKVMGGYKQGNGIVCSCCNIEISPSQFEAHAGCAAKRQPYRHIYTSNGLTLHDIALMLANGQSIATNNSDDMCTICGDAGELICCEGCPRAFHAACLGLQCTPTSGWLCSYCRDKFVPGRKTAGDAGPIMIRLTRVVKAPESEGGGCVVCRTPDFSVAKFDDRTVMLCDQCEKEYHVGCLRESGLCDLKELPKDKWFCCNDCNKVYVVLQNCVLKGAEVIPAPAAAAVTKKRVQNCLMDTATNDIQWRILSGKSRFAEHLPLLSSAAVIFRECFDPIVAKSGRDLIPVMVYGRNISGQEFGGMYCIVLIVKSVVVSAGLLRIFGQEVAELPLVATSRENQGKGYFQALFGCIEILLSSMHVKNLVLPAAEEAESIWTNKLGFRKMTDERYLKYSRDYQLTIFKGTSMLEKEVQQTAYEL